MPYITTAERIGIEKGIAQGIEQSMPTIHEAITTILEIKFGEAGQRLHERVNQMKNLETLQKLMVELKRAQSLPEAEKIFQEIEIPVS